MSFFSNIPKSLLQEKDPANGITNRISRINYCKNGPYEWKLPNSLLQKKTLQVVLNKRKPRAGTSPIACCRRRHHKWVISSIACCKKKDSTDGISRLACCKRRPCRWSFANSGTKGKPRTRTSPIACCRKRPLKWDYKWDFPNSLLQERAHEWRFPQ